MSDQPIENEASDVAVPTTLDPARMPSELDVIDPEGTLIGRANYHGAQGYGIRLFEEFKEKFKSRGESGLKIDDDGNVYAIEISLP